MSKRKKKAPETWQMSIFDWIDEQIRKEQAAKSKPAAVLKRAA